MLYRAPQTRRDALMDTAMIQSGGPEELEEEEAGGKHKLFLQEFGASQLVAEQR
jgi:hypothetical protein